MHAFKLLVIISTILFFSEASSQNWMDWDSLGNDVNFYKIQKQFNDYWGPKNIGHNTPKNQMGGWKAFKRWEWYWEQRVAPTGEFPLAGHNLMELRKWKSRKENSKEKKQDINNWTNVGPFESDGGYSGLGRINWVEEDPDYNGTTNKTIWIGSPGGGLWKTEDDGATWESKFEGFGSMGVSSIIIDPVDSDIMYIATGDGDVADTYSIGVLKSTDGGQTWNTTGLNWTTSNNRTIRKIVMDPNDNDILYAATSNGIYKTVNAGSTWTQVRATTRYFDIEFKPGSSDTLYASGFYEVIRTTNAGTNWTVLGGGLPTTGIYRIELAVSPNNPNYVYALSGYSGGNNNSGFHSVYRSTDGGTNWTARATYDGGTPNLLGWESDGGDTGGQAWYDLTLEVSPTDVNMLFIGGVNCWKSTNGGTNWSISSHWWGDGVDAVHADHHYLGFAKNTSRLYNGNDGGIYRTTNNGTDWTWLGNGLPITQLYRLGTSKTNSTRIIAGAQDNGTKLLKSGNWYDAIGGDGMECIISHSNADIMYGTLYYGALRKSVNAGSSFSNVTVSSSEQGGWVSPYVMHPTDANTIYMGYKNIYKTVNAGSNWTAITSGWSSNLSVLHVAPSNPDYIYAGTGSTLKYTSNGGTNWISITLPISQTLTYLAINYTNPLKIYATFSGYSAGNKVFYSTDAGTSWTNISDNLPNVPVNTIIYQKSLNNRIYIGTDIGVFWIDDNEDGWQDFNGDLPDVEITELEIHYATNKLRAATYGRGVWESDITPSNEVDTPELKSPTNNSINFAFNDKLIWLKSTNATSYGLQISLNSDMSNPLYSKTGLTDTTFVIKDTLLAYNTNYYWRVNAKKDTITSNWSSIWKFKTQEYALTPTQIAPSNNSVGIANNTKIIWSKASLSDSYGLQVSVNANMSSPIISVTGLVDTTYTIVDTIFNYATTYYWRVNSKRDNQTSSWSDIWNFKLKVNIAAPTLTFPANNASGIKLTDSLKWSAVTGATKYQLVISTDQNFTTNFYDGIITNNFFWLGTLNVKMNTNYYWKVLSMQNNEVGEWSSVFKFTTRTSNHVYCIPSTSTCDEYISKVVFNTISKESDCDSRYSDYSDYITGVTKGNVYTLTVTNAIPYTSDYVGVWFDWNQDGDFDDSGEFTQLSTTNFSTFTGNISIPMTATKGKTMMRTRIVWSISLNPCTYSDYGEAEDYSVYINPTPLSTPTLTTPTNNSVNLTLPVGLGWNTVTNASSYTLQVSTTSNFSTLLVNTTQSGLTYNLQNLNYSTVYYWRVMANNADTTSNWSTTYNFKTFAKPVDLLLPTNNAIKQIKTLILKWSHIPSVTNYQLQLSKFNDFSTNLLSFFTTDTSYYASLFHSSQFYWRTRAVYNTDTSAWSSVWSFTTKDSLTVPIITTPANNATNQKTNLTFNWNDVNFAEKYRLQVSTSNNFTTLLKDEWLVNSEYNLTNLSYNTVYYWRVLAADFADTTAYSSTWQFTTKQNLTVPVLATPTNNATNQKTNLTLNWNDVNFAEKYRLQVSTSNNFTTLLKDEWLVNSEYNLTNLSYNTTYYWRVLAADFADTTAFPGTWQFTTKQNLTIPVLVSPSNNATNQKTYLTLNWNDVNFAEKYRLQVSTLSNFSTLIKDEWLVNSEYNFTNLNYNTTYYWRVLAADFADTTAFSGTWQFTTKQNLTVPVLASPSNNATNQKTNLTLNWDDVNFAEKYRLQVSTSNTFTTLLKDEWLENNEYNLANLSYNTTYYWRVLAADFADTTEFSSTWQFTTKQNLTVPVLASPSNNATNQKTNLTLNWNDVNFAEKYRLQVSTSNTFVTLLKDEWLVNSEYNLTNLSYNTVYYWRVLAADFADTTEFSSTWQFTTKQNLTVPVLASPSNNATNQKVNLTLNWDDVNFAEKYRLQVSTSNTFVTLLKDEWLVNSEYNLTNLSYNTVYYWRVLAADFADTTAFSGTWQFTTKQNLTVPVLASPSNNATNQKTNLTLNWNDVNFAEKYRLQVSASNTFATLLTDEWLDNSDYNLTNLSFNTTYYWRVLAVDFADTTAFSGTWQFTTKQNLTVPVLILPTNNSTNQKVYLTLNWNNVNFAEKYRLQVSTLNNFSTLLKDEWLVNSEYNLTNLNYNTVYYWRVLAADFADTTAFSGTWQFTTLPRPTAPTLISINNNDEYVSLTPKLIWSEILNADSYRVQVARDVNFNTIAVDVTNPNLPSYIIETGRLNQLTNYYWRVNVIVDGDTSNWSSAWKFKTGNSSSINKYVVSLLGNKSDNCDVVWVENNIDISSISTTSDDCGGEGNCIFTNSNDKLNLNNARIKFNFVNLNPFVDSIKIIIKNNCGSNCTQAFMYDNEYLIDEKSSPANGIITLTLMNNYSRITDLFVSSCNAELLEIVLFTNGKYPDNVPSDWAYTEETGSYSIISVPKNVDNLINGRKLMVGDAIGVFFDDNSVSKCAGYSVWNGNDLNIKIWGDDPNTIIKDGFGLNEDYTIKLWDGQESKSIATKVKYSSGPSYFENAGFSVLSQLFGNDIIHSIILNQGWNLTSSYINPTNASMSKVFENNIDDVVIVKNAAGKIYMPSSNTNTIGNWNYKEGYQIYVSKSTILKVFGMEVIPQNTPIYLNKGWSIIPYSRKFEANIGNLLQTIEEYNNLVIIKNSAGQIYMPNSMNTIGNMKPGQAYQAYLKEKDTLIYIANYAERNAGSYDLIDDFSANHLKTNITATSKSMVIQLYIANGQTGDEIGVWNENGLLLGSSLIVDKQAVITIWGADEFTNQIYTAKNNDKLHFKILPYGSKELLDVNTSSIYSLLNTDVNQLIYNDNEVLSIKVDIKGLDRDIPILGIYPNPAKDLLYVEIELSDNTHCELGIFDLMGQQIDVIANDSYNSGKYKFNVNLKDIPNGTYSIRLKMNNKVANKQFVIIK